MKNSLFLALLPLSAVVAADTVNVDHLAQVSNVSFTQNGEQDVIVSYDLDNGGEPAFVTLDVLTNGVPLPVSAVQTLSGDVSASLSDFVADGTGKKIVWKARTDWKGNLASNATVVVSAHYTNHLEGVYLRVDVSGGMEADAWPTHFGSVEPDLTSKAFLWDELWLKCVPAGTFHMGSPEDELNHYANETRHQVTLTKPFFIGVTPVTRKQWTNMAGKITNLTVDGYEACPARWIRYTHTIDSPTRSDTVFARLAEKTGLHGFGLPTEAQWEYACRADTASTFNDGSPWDPDLTSTKPTVSANLDKLAWYKNNSGDSDHQVATKKPNAWGLYDFHGGVWELCRDSARTYTSEAVVNPIGDMPKIDGTCVKRGGSTSSDAYGCRSAYRNTSQSVTAAAEANGIRLAFEF
ncbi:MAG: formylglycine-generating enzyme family protein [Kiritimatiellae bacterium]|nr:formylglycine-generating enzyme family protein [Kiritimatiellia bacterium]